MGWKTAGSLFLGLLGLVLMSREPAQAQPLCPPGTEWHPGLRRCVSPPPPCPPDSTWSHRSQRCVRECPPGTVWVRGHGCRPVGAYPPPPPGYVPPPPPPPGYLPPPPPPQRWATPPGLPVPGTMMVVRASSLNLRDCPGKRCGIIMVLGPGEPVAFHDFRHGFALVRVPGRGVEGWVDYRYLALP